jgi:MacB-like periplasmic core domain
MIFAYLKSGFRGLLKNKAHSLLNLFGLAIGIACAGLIFLWVEDEMHYDSTQVKKDDLYFVRVNMVLDAGIFTHGSSPGILGPAIQAEIPGIANTCRTSEGDTRMLFSIGDRSVYASGKYAEPSLFNMFTLPFVQGNPKTAFSQRYSIVITEKTAKKFFGNEQNLVGKSVRMDNKQNYIVTGIVKDIPENSSFKFEWLAPFDVWFQQSPWAHEWGNNCLSTYVELKPGANLTAINNQLYNFVQKRAPQSINHVFLFGMRNWHLYDDFQNGKPTGSGQITYVRLFSIIAWIILLIAGLTWEGKTPGNKILISWRSVTPEYFPTNGISILDGRNFYPTDTINYDLPSNNGNAVITKSFADLLGKVSAIGKIIHDQNDTMLKATVVGVVNDYVYGNMYGKPDPVIFFCTSPRFENTMYVRTKSESNPEQVIAKMETIFKKDNPGYPFEFRFVDDQFNEMFQNEMLISRLSRVFAGLAIMITCLGLFGLAAYTAERRIKEIGIRKVLGASVSGLAGLLSMEFLKLVLVSVLVAFPLAWYAMNKWLQDYTYRVSIQWWVFPITGIVAILIALITVSFQTIRAALANPVKSLKTE